MSKALAVIPILLACAWIGCGGTTGDTSSALVRDSAGIRIVEHPADFEAPVWQIGATPDADIGEVDGDSTTLLFQVEGAHRLSDGTIVVANRSSNELRFWVSLSAAPCPNAFGFGPSECR